MKTGLLFSIFFFLLINYPLSAADSRLDEESAKLFFTVNDFSLQDQTGKLHQLTRKINSKYVVLYSYVIGCPIGRRNIPALKVLSEKFKENEVSFFYLAPALQDTREAISAEVETYKLPFPVLLDETQEIARQLKINRTGEVVVINMNNFKIEYRGPVDDKQTYEGEKTIAPREYLNNALKDLLQTKRLKKPYIKSLGCALTIRPRPEVTYYKNIAPILENKCSSCHIQNQIEPNNFFDYSSAKNWSTMIKEVIQTELMPPWEVDRSISVKNQMVLSREEKEEIYSWIESGMKEGSKEDFKGVLNPESYNLRTKANEKEFNYELKTKEPVSIKADGKITWHYELVDINNGDDFWINSITNVSEFSSKNIIQHSQLIIAKEEIPEILTAREEFLPYKHLTKLYSIVNMSNQINVVASSYTDKAHRIPKGARIYLETHFAKTGKDEVAKLKVAMKKYDKSQKFKEIHYTARTHMLDFKIPANNSSYILRKQIPFNRNVSVFRMAAHMHLRGTGSKVYLKNADGSNRQLVYSSRYLFKNRRTYDLINPIEIPKGSFLETELEYDNSKGNPARINHNEDVVWGEDANTGEMMLMHLYYTLND